MRTSPEGVALIKEYEGLRLKAYRCPAGVWTIGVGHTGAGVKADSVLTEHQANAVLDVDLDRFERGVLSALDGTPATQPQFDALVSFAFNLGVAALARSTLLRKFKAGDVEGAGAEFMKWQYAAGKVMPGLVRRRAAERALFLKVDE